MATRAYVYLAAVVLAAFAGFNFSTKATTAEPAAKPAEAAKPVEVAKPAEPVKVAEPPAEPTRRPAGGPGRWQIHRAEYAYSDDDVSRNGTNTILLDTETGDTWLMWPVDEDYAWVKMPKIGKK